MLLSFIFLFYLIAAQHIKSLDDRDHHKGAQHAAAAVAHQRKRDACHRDQFGPAADREKNLRCVGRAESDRGEPVEPALQLHGYVHEHDEYGQTGQDQTDAEDAAHFLHDGAEHEVLLHVRDRSRTSLVEACPEPASRGDGEKGLTDLIARACVVFEGVAPDLDADPDMGEQEVGGHRRDSSRHDPDGYQKWISCSYEQHDEVGHEEDQGSSQVCGDHQDAYVSGRQDGRQDDSLQAVLARQKSGDREHEDDLDELGGLECEAGYRQGQLGPVDRPGGNHDQAEQAYADEDIGPGHPCENVKLSHDDRYEKGQDRSQAGQSELLYRFIVG